MHFADEVYDRPDVELYIGVPPVRARKDQDALWEGIAKGTTRASRSSTPRRLVAQGSFRAVRHVICGTT